MVQLSDLHALSRDRDRHDHASHVVPGRPAQPAGAQHPLAARGFLYSHANHLFVVFHFYMLLNLVLLARTAKSFEDSLARTFPDDGVPRETFRMRIENTLFVQLLVGGRLEREGINAKLLSWMALITLALAPVLLLLMIQIKFLPYHSEWITWWHRILLFVDLALVWTLWPGYRKRLGRALAAEGGIVVFIMASGWEHAGTGLRGDSGDNSGREHLFRRQRAVWRRLRPIHAKKHSAPIWGRIDRRCKAGTYHRHE